MLSNILQGPSLLFHKSFLILGNAARCASLKIPQIASEDDIRVLFLHDVLSTIFLDLLLQALLRVDYFKPINSITVALLYIYSKLLKTGDGNHCFL